MNNYINLDDFLTMEKGELNWVFCDGDLPQKDDSKMDAHEALMVLNMNDTDAELDVTLLFQDKDPVEHLILKVSAKRVKCFRLDKPLGDANYQIPFGQYALTFTSTVPVFAVFGRLDTTQPNMAYYTVQGHNF